MSSSKELVRGGMDAGAECSEGPRSEANLVIGLTGGIGTGKSTASLYLKEQGLAHIDADGISRSITVKKPGVRNPLLEEIGRVFGADAAGDTNQPGGSSDSKPSDDNGSDGTSVAQQGESSSHASVLRPDGSLDRKAMADLVFHDPEKKRLLEEIMFREIRAEIDRQMDAAAKAGQDVLLDVPLLFESGLDQICDCVIALVADQDVRVQRVVARDGCSAEDVLARIANQMPDQEKAERADFVVDNSGTLEEMETQLAQVLKEIRTLN